MNNYNTGIIYLISNSINENKYVGQTIFSLEHRWNQHLAEAKRKSSKSKLYLDMQKYGLDKFWAEILISVPIDDLNDYETHYISFYDSFKNGYNRTMGGEGNKKYEFDMNEVVEKYLSGISANKLAEMYGCSKPLMRNLISSRVQMRDNSREYDVDKVLLLYAEGKSSYDIGKELGYGATSVRRILSANKVTRDKHECKRKSTINEAELVKDYINGHSVRKLTLKYTCDRCTVDYILEKSGVSQREVPQGKILALPLDDILKMYDSGMAPQKIADFYNVSYTAIYYRLKKAGAIHGK